MLRLRLVVGKVVPSFGSGGGNTLTHWGLVVVIPLLGVKTRCAEKSTAEHYEIDTYIHGGGRF